MKWNNIPLWWRNFFLNMENNRDYVNTYCSTLLNGFDRHCREGYRYNSGKNLDELPDVEFYW